MNKSSTKAFRMYCVENREKPKPKVGWPKGRKRGPRQLKIVESNDNVRPLVSNGEDDNDVEKIITEEKDSTVSPTPNVQQRQGTITGDELSDLKSKKLRRKSNLDLSRLHSSIDLNKSVQNFNELGTLTRVSPRKKNIVSEQLTDDNLTKSVVVSTGENIGNEFATPVTRKLGRPKGSLSGPRKPKQVIDSETATPMIRKLGRPKGSLSGPRKSKQVKEVDSEFLKLTLDILDKAETVDTVCGKIAGRDLRKNELTEKIKLKCKKIKDLSSTSSTTSLNFLEPKVGELSNQKSNSAEIQRTDSEVLECRQERLDVNVNFHHGNKIVTFHEDKPPPPMQEIDSSSSLLLVTSVPSVVGKLKTVTVKRARKKIRRNEIERQRNDEPDLLVLDSSVSVNKTFQELDNLKEPECRVIPRSKSKSSEERLVSTDSLKIVSFQAEGIDQSEVRRQKESIGRNKCSPPEVVSDAAQGGGPEQYNENPSRFDFNTIISAGDANYKSDKEDDDFFAFLDDVPVHRTTKRVGQNKGPRLKERRPLGKFGDHKLPNSGSECPPLNGSGHFQIVSFHADVHQSHELKNQKSGEKTTSAGIQSLQEGVIRADEEKTLDSEGNDQQSGNTELKKKRRKKKKELEKYLHRTSEVATRNEGKDTVIDSPARKSNKRSGSIKNESTKMLKGKKVGSLNRDLVGESVEPLKRKGSFPQDRPHGLQMRKLPLEDKVCSVAIDRQLLFTVRVT